jgi:hypothetical protein
MNREAIFNDCATIAIDGPDRNRLYAWSHRRLIRWSQVGHNRPDLSHSRGPPIARFSAAVTATI